MNPPLDSSRDQDILLYNQDIIIHTILLTIVQPPYYYTYHINYYFTFHISVHKRHKPHIIFEPPDLSQT